MQLDVQLDREFVVPHATITGIVKLKGAEDILAKHIYIEIFGIAECSWEDDATWLDKLLYPKYIQRPELPTRGHSRVSVFTRKPIQQFWINDPKMENLKDKLIYKGDQQFFQCRHTLGGGDDHSTFEKRTNHLFPFKCRLPGHLPPTWAGMYGTVRYYCRVTLHFLNDQPTQIAVHPVLVSQYRDLKLEKHLLYEVRKDVVRKYRYSLLSLGHVHISIWMPLCGIAAGQKLPVLCTINNNSAVRFNGITFVLTKVEIYRSTLPKKRHKVHRVDICRIPRISDIVDGQVEFYAVLQTNEDTYPTSQFWRCNNCQVTYEVWVSLSCPLPDKSKYGRPTFSTPGIPIIIGTEPICSYDSNRITMNVMQALLDSHPPIIMEPPPPDEVVEEMLNTVEEDMDMDTMKNLGRQIDINENLVDS